MRCNNRELSSSSLASQVKKNVCAGEVANMKFQCRPAKSKAITKGTYRLSCSSHPTLKNKYFDWHYFDFLLDETEFQWVECNLQDVSRWRSEIQYTVYITGVSLLTVWFGYSRKLDLSVRLKQSTHLRGGHWLGALHCHLYWNLKF